MPGDPPTRSPRPAPPGPAERATCRREIEDLMLRGDDAPEAPIEDMLDRGARRGPAR
ncbi:hypothetical protein [Palleronia sediminis]|uniref:hypothetical protein n=1 Tax=Palleronia sediminis TaxID=2547833 RepID=UPI001455249A|nr:hypothetical protein [Palleronia sediminis]